MWLTGKVESSALCAIGQKALAAHIRRAGRAFLVGEIERFIEKRLGEALDAAPKNRSELESVELWWCDQRCQARTVSVIC
jgi:hypothetical protein